MYTVSKTFNFCYGHRLLNDAGKCRHLHGHTAMATIILGSEELCDRGMVAHFDDLKETIGDWISKNLDHTLIISKDDPVKNALDQLGERYLAIPCNPTAENIAKMIFEKALEFNLPIIKVEAWESDTSMATYEKTNWL